MRIRYILIALLVAVVGIWAGYSFSQTEEKKVKRQFSYLSEWVSKEPGEKALTAAKKTKNIGTLFSEDCSLKIPIPSLSGHYTPEEVSGYAARYRSYFSKVSLKFYDLAIHFPQKGIAKVSATVRLSGRSTMAENIDEIRELQCFLKKNQKRWLFSHVEVIEVLKK